MNELIPLRRRHACIALLASVLLTPCTTRATFDLTGDWRVRSEFFDETTVFHLEQDGTSLRFGGLLGDIDPESGRFEVALIPTTCANPFGIYAQATDNDHFSGSVGGFWDPLSSPCHVAGGQSITGERVGLPSTPTPTPTPLLPTSTPAVVRCVGDCDGDGRTTVDEIVRLVRCIVSICLSPVIALPADIECADSNGSGAVEVTELVTAVNNALHGCPH